MKFRPCIDLHQGVVKQIVGSTLKDHSDASLITNFESSMSARDYARMYREDKLMGGHIIMLGANEANCIAAMEALKEYPGGMQVGGGINPQNAMKFIDAGATHVIVTSYVFCDGKLDYDRLHEIKQSVGKNRLVLDLSCRKKKGTDTYYVVTDRWQTFTELPICKQTLVELASHCDEFLVHAVDVEGMKCGIIEDLVEILANWSPIPVTYAGGARSLEDFEKVLTIGNGKVDLSVGSALDIFGGEVPYHSVVRWNASNQSHL